MQIKKDGIQRFLLDEANARGEMAYLNLTYQQIIEQRPYPAVIRRLLGETLIACLLIADTLKFEGSLSIQFEGDPRFSLLLVQCDNQLNLRALAKFEPDLADDEYNDAFLHGQMVFTLKTNIKSQDYQSKLPIRSLSMGSNLMHYFAQSEQIPSFVWLGAEQEHAGGMLLQLLPSPDSNKQSSEERETFWEYALHMGQTISEKEFFNTDNEELLHRLYHETTIRLFPYKKARFQCRCTPAKMEHVLRTLGEEECQKLLSTYKMVEASCDFCNQVYSFDAIDIATLFHYKS